eukprot:9470944-Pyramimonas_sp.AAC.1
MASQDVLRPSWAALERSGTVSRLSWTLFGASEGSLPPSWGSPWVILRALWSRVQLRGGGRSERNRPQESGGPLEGLQG